jgi:hypothetical protein
MHPTDAQSPRGRVSEGTVRVLYTHPSTDWSVATMTYDNIPGRVGIRWNGNIADRADLGYPSARGNGAWFILPDGVAETMLGMVAFAKTTDELFNLSAPPQS